MMARKGRDRRHTSRTEQIAVRLDRDLVADVRRFGSGNLTLSVAYFFRLGVDRFLEDHVGDGLTLGTSGALEAEMRRVLGG
jgi:hypothetical protein